MATATPPPQRASFIHKERKDKKKSLLLLLLLLFSRKNKWAPLVVAAMTFFLLGAPFGWDLGRVSEFLEKKPGLSWLAKAFHAADRFLESFKVGSAAYLDARFVMAGRGEDAEFDLKAYRQRAADLEGRGGEPEDFVRGGDSLSAEVAAERAKEAKGGAVKPAPVDTRDQANSESTVVQADGAVGQGDPFGGTRMGSMQENAFGSASTFQGRTGAIQPKDSLTQSLTNASKGQGAGPPDKPKKLKTSGLRGFQGGNRRGDLSGRQSKLVGFGNRYRYRLGEAMSQTDYASRQADSYPETAHNFDGAWADGNMLAPGLDAQGTDTPVPATPNMNNVLQNIEADTRGLEDCLDSLDSYSGDDGANLSSYEEIMDCIRVSCPPDYPNGISATFEAEANYMGEHQPPGSCDEDGINNYNPHIDRLNKAIDDFNAKMIEAQAACGEISNTHSQMGADCPQGASSGGGGPSCDQGFKPLMAEEDRPKRLEYGGWFRCKALPVMAILFPGLYVLISVFMGDWSALLIGLTGPIGMAVAGIYALSTGLAMDEVLMSIFTPGEMGESQRENANLDELDPEAMDSQSDEYKIE